MDFFTVPSDNFKKKLSHGQVNQGFNGSLLSCAVLTKSKPLRCAAPADEHATMLLGLVNRQPGISHRRPGHGLFPSISRLGWVQQ